MTEDLLVDPGALREQVRDKYREVALKPDASFHFHTGRRLAARLGYDPGEVAALPDRAVESFAGVGNPFSLRRLDEGSNIVDVGSGAGFDTFVAAGQVGEQGRAIGVDMTPEMLDRSRETAAEIGISNVEFRAGLAEDLPVESGWADAVISNGGDQSMRRQEVGIRRIAGGLPRAGWQAMLEECGFVDVVIGPAVDTFGGARGEEKARSYEVFGYAFLARRP